MGTTPTTSLDAHLGRTDAGDRLRGRTVTLRPYAARQVSEHLAAALGTPSRRCGS